MKLIIIDTSMKLFKYNNYEEYVENQIKTNEKKLSRVWASDFSMKLIMKYIQKNIPNATMGLCHGVRNGWEVKRLRKLLGIEVIGTDISPTATRFENVIQWDFHDVKPEWINSIDFIYSNSFDHSYKPSECLDQWMSCIKKTGRCFIEWSINHSHGGSPVDCFGATLEEYKKLIGEKYLIDTVLLSDHKNEKMKGHIIAIKHKD